MKDQPIIAEWIKWNQYFGVYWVDVDSTKPYKPKPIGLYSVYEDFEEFMRDMLMKQAKSSYRQGIEDAFKEIHNLGYSVFQAQKGIHPPAIEIERLENLKCKLLKNQSDKIS
jgi:hypothetical protein